jgi:hypothetical protein
MGIYQLIVWPITCLFSDVLARVFIHERLMLDMRGIISAEPSVEAERKQNLF